MFDKFTKWLESLNKQDDKIQLKEQPSVEHNMIWMNEELLKNIRETSFIWSFSWSDKEETIKFVSSFPYCRYIELYKTQESHISLISTTLSSIEYVLSSYPEYSTPLYIGLKEDVELNIPQSYINNVYLNSHLTFHRTTLDGQLDEDFNLIENKSDATSTLLGDYKLLGYDDPSTLINLIEYSMPDKYKNTKRQSLLNLARVYLYNKKNDIFFIYFGDIVSHLNFKYHSIPKYTLHATTQTDLDFNRILFTLNDLIKIDITPNKEQVDEDIDEVISDEIINTSTTPSSHYITSIDTLKGD